MLSKTLAGLALGAATAEAFAPTPMGMFGSRAGIEKRAGIAAQPLVAAPVASRRSTVSAVQGLKAAETKTGLPASVKPGVVTGQALVDLLQYAKDKKFAMPGVNIVGTNSINACMEAAAKYGGPIMVTFSKGGGQFIAGKTLNNDNDQASIAGTIAGARHVREVAKLYGEKRAPSFPNSPPIFLERRKVLWASATAEGRMPGCQLCHQGWSLAGEGTWHRLLPQPCRGWQLLQAIPVQVFGKNPRTDRNAVQASPSSSTRTIARRPGSPGSMAS